MAALLTRFGSLLLLLGSLGAGCADSAGGDRGVATHVGDWRDEIIYQIVVDRFDNAEPANDWQGEIGPVPGDLRRHQGGDWAGVRRRLGYIQRMGVTTLWLSPIVANVDRTDYQDGYHGYWASNFAKLNARFGDLDALRGLVDEAHDRGMKVIIDVVINHAGRIFYYDFDDNGAMGDGEAEPTFSETGAYDAPVSWLTPPPTVFRRAADGGEPDVVALDESHFHRRGQTTDGSSSQKELGDFPTGLRDLDSENPAVMTAMVDTYVRWVELTDVDGFRLDAVPHAPHAYWSEFAERTRARLAALGKVRFLLLGEVFDEDPTRQASYTAAGGLDSVFDFSLKSRVIDGFILDGKPAAEAMPALESYRSFYPAAPHPGGVELSPWQARVAFVDNHDMPRLRYWLDDPWAAELAMTVVYTVDAIPAVYYGTEQGFKGGWGNASREVMWETGFDEDTRMYRYLARLAELRRELPALRRGRLQLVYASQISAQKSGDGAGLLAWERFIDRAQSCDCDEPDAARVLVALNGHPIDRARARVSTGFAAGTELRDGLRGGIVRVGDGGVVELDVAPREAVILLPLLSRSTSP